MKQYVPHLFVAVCAFASGWALYLVKLHNDAVGHLLTPGALCGPEGGCSDVLASEWGTIFGVTASAPAVPMFAGLAVLTALGIAGKIGDWKAIARVSTLFCATAMAFGLWLLYHMAFDIQKVCQYCLIMDASTLVALLLAANLHPDGPLASFKELGSAADDARIPGALVALIAAGGLAITALLPEPDPAEAPVPEVVFEASEPATPAPMAATAAVPAPDTRRVVIQDQVFDLPDSAGHPVRGNADGPVTIAVFEDFQCPFCATLTNNLHSALDGRDDVKLVWFHFPMHKACNDAGIAKSMHPWACGAAIASVCADNQGKFWEFHDRTYANQAHLKPADLRGHAVALKLDMAAYDACIRTPEPIAKVKADSVIGGTVKVTGTPAFFVNGHRFSGGQPTEVITAIIEAVKAGPTERVLLDVPLAGEIIGEVKGPETVSISGPAGLFEIDAYEASITNGKAASKPGVNPASNVTWYQARDACEAAGKRLCSEEEWLVACTGEEPVDADRDGRFSDDPIRGRAHPYGPFPQATWCAASRKKDDPRPLITGNHPKCATPEGVYDLEGLTKEWIGVTADKAAVKGGSYYSIGSARCGYFKDSLAVDSADPSVGFRCCSGELPDSAISKIAEGGRIGDQIRDWELKTLEGGTMSSADLKGKPFIMTFWASYCGPCRKELPALGALYQQYKSKGLEIVAVNVDKSVGAARGFMKNTPILFPVVLDNTGAVQRTMDARTLPTTFFVKADGTIRQRTTGYDARFQRELEENVRTLVEGDQ